jgi:parallel beta-helix repeat protein
LIYRNGPLGRANSAETIANATPSVPLLWSNDRYEVIPTDQIDKTKNKIDAVLGIGVVLGGVGKAEISGNSFIFNDVMSLIVVSVDDLIFRENVIERNGFHQNLDKVQLYKYSFSAMRSWNISKSFALQYNLIIDNVQNGIEIVHPQNQKNRLKIDIKGNHFGGNGQVLKDLPLPMGKGLVLDALADSGGLDIQAEYNYYAQNRLIGLYAYGNVSGRFTNNLLINNQGTPILFVDDSTKQDKLDPASLPTMVIGNNELNNGRGVGIRFYGNANVRPYIGSNSVVDLQTVQTNPAKENGKIIQTADAINITKVASGEVIIRNNKLIDNQRAGIFVEKANVKVENNTIKNSDYLIVQGEQANITGSDSSLAVVPKEKLENEPPLR